MLIALATRELLEERIYSAWSERKQRGGEPDTLTPETFILLHTLHTSASEKPALLGPLFLLPPFLAESVWLHTPESVYFKAIAR